MAQERDGDYALRIARLILQPAGHASDVALLRRAELRIRQEFGGRRFYIPRGERAGGARSAAVLADISAPHPRP